MERRNGAQIGHANGRGDSAVLAEREPLSLVKMMTGHPQVPSHSILC